MKFGFLSEGETPAGKSYTTRYWELIDEVLLAEKMGFDVFGTSEQHVPIGGVSTTCPEVLYSYLAAKTSRIRIRHTAVVLPYRINHPIRVAERAAAEDILSHGRIEVYMARGNTTTALRAFNVDLNETLPQWEEGFALIRRALAEDLFTFEGQYFQVPPRRLVPKPVQKPYPPLGAIATSERSHQRAGELGIGAISHSNFKGWEYLRAMRDLYVKAWQPDPYGAREKPYSAVLVLAHCAETKEKAREEASDRFATYIRNSWSSYPVMAKHSQDYGYMKEVADLFEQLNNYDYLVNDSASAVIGDPEDCIRQIERYQSLGYDEVMLRIDSLEHHEHLKSIEMFGKYVIPHFKDRNNICPPYEEILAEIRAHRKNVAETGAPDASS